MDLSYMFWIGVISTIIGAVSFIALGWIFYKYHDMYPWFGGLQPWITGYYLLPFGLYLLIVRWMFTSEFASYELSLADSIIIIFLFILLFGGAIAVQHYYRKLMVLVGRMESEEENLPDVE